MTWKGQQEWRGRACAPGVPRGPRPGPLMLVLGRPWALEGSVHGPVLT